MICIQFITLPLISGHYVYETTDISLQMTVIIYEFHCGLDNNDDLYLAVMSEYLILMELYI